MLCLSKRTEYALIALAHLAEQSLRIASAREMAQQHALPPQMLMNILKNLQGHGILRSTRGVKGGYQIVGSLEGLTLSKLISVIDCPGHAGEGDCGCLEAIALAVEKPDDLVGDSHGPVQALQSRLNRFLREVFVADLVWPGRRIDVPLERLKFSKINSLGKTTFAAGEPGLAKNRSLQHVDHSV